MKVFVRHIDNAEGVFFTECEFDQLDDVIALVRRSGGFLCDGEHEEFHSYQLVCDEGVAYAEIIIGSEEE